MALKTTEELRLVTLGVDIGRSATIADACRIAIERLEGSAAIRCDIRAHIGTDWHSLAPGAGRLTPAEAEHCVRIPLTHGQSATELLIAPAPGVPASRGSVNDPAWRDALAGMLSASLQLVELRAQLTDADRLVEGVSSFSRALLGISDSATLHRTIVEHMARAVNAEIGAFAVLIPQEGTLAITATVGYPAVLVEHLRLAPGEGILGRVYATGEPIVAMSQSDLPGQIARRRYRTDSFVAIPLSGPEGVVGVVSLTDKIGPAFSQADLSVLFQMAVPAALAVSRELLRDRTNDLAHLATVDPLTGLFNRRYFETRLEQELQRQRRQDDDLSLLMLDLDNFKELNDTQGHLVGDVALKEVAEILRRAVRIFDVCARYGGEEFVILMPGAGASTALRIAERIRRQVEQHFAGGRRSGVPIPLTVSIGVGTATPSVTRDVIIAQADEGLLVAKSRGKNQVVPQFVE
jgi:diguanylate cyclase (GGDEF)-like protein